MTCGTALIRDIPKTWLFVEPAQDRREVPVELRGDCVEVTEAVQSQEENMFLRKRDLELIRMRRDDESHVETGFIRNKQLVHKHKECENNDQK